MSIMFTYIFSYEKKHGIDVPACEGYTYSELVKSVGEFIKDRIDCDAYYPDLESGTVYLESDYRRIYLTSDEYGEFVDDVYTNSGIQGALENRKFYESKGRSPNAWGE